MHMCLYHAAITLTKIWMILILIGNKHDRVGSMDTNMTRVGSMDTNMTELGLRTQTMTRVGSMDTNMTELGLWTQT